MTYLAEDLRFPHRPKVVVKHLKPQISDESTLKFAGELFHQEAEILYRLGRHPNIPSLVAHFTENGEFYLVQEFIEGHTLDKEFLGGKRYNQHEIIQLLGQILEILSFVHREKVIHRDIKPANIIRSNTDGQLYLIDFGAVKQVNSFPTNTQQQNLANNSVAIGSHGYMPLEQMAGNPNFSSDLYALGLVIIEALTGIKPLDLKKNYNTSEFIWAHKVQLSPEVESFINKLVRYDSRQRFFSAKEALAVLNPIAARVGFFHNKPAVSVPLIIPPISSDSSFAVNNVPIRQTQTPEVPPTIIVSPQFEPRFNRVGETKNVSAVNYFGESNPQISKSENPKFLRNISLALLGFAFLTFLFWMGTGGVKFLTGQREVAKNEKPKAAPMIIEEPTLDVYEEANKQADEAKGKEAKATTKFEWNEIGNQYKRAYLLLASLEESHPNYKDARELIENYKQQSENAFKKAETAEDNNVLKQNTNLMSENGSKQSQTIGENVGIATMPPPRKNKIYIAFNSSPGDFSGGGKSKVLTDNDANFEVYVEKNGGISVRVNGGPDSCYLSFAAPQGAKLQKGAYSGAQRYPFQSPTRPGLSFSGPGGCNQLTGNFTINNIVYTLDNKYILLLDATFVQFCETTMPPVKGRIRYDVRD